MSRLAEQLVVSAAGQGVQLTGESGLLTAVAGDRPGAVPDLRRPPGSQLSQPCQTQTIRQTPGSFTCGVWDELGCKPGSVHWHLAVPAGDHLSRPAVADRLVRSTRRLGRAALEHLRSARRRLLTLLRVGFAVPFLSPGTRWSLTPPFHPYRRLERRPAVCFLWHFPADHSGSALPTTLPCGARTFLDRRAEARRTRSPAQLVRRKSTRAH